MAKILSPCELAAARGHGDMFAMFINEGVGRASEGVLMARVYGWPKRIADVARAELARCERLEAE